MLKSFPLLETINFPVDLKRLSINQLPELCHELRSFLIDSILTHGGHFAANLGVIELTVALHFVFDTPGDKLVWDVGHQAYAHKVLTGRRALFHTNRKMGGLSGFPKISESEYDAFGTGHSSTAISAVLGMATAAKLDGNLSVNNIAIVGDGALTAGQAFEGLNNLSGSGTNTLLILNDNGIGIDVNTGAINRHFNSLNPIHNLFTDLGLDYSGPVDGHDVLLLVELLSELKKNIYPRVLHIKTIKGKGFLEAEKEQTKWHSTSRFVKIEDPESKIVKNRLKYQDVFGQTLTELAYQNHKIVGVTPAMPTGSGMIKAMEAFPDRFFDVGIAEQHAVTFSAGMATQGYIVFCSLYSTFLQRAYDQIIHDVCLQNLPVIFCIDRAGNVGDDGPTHHGLFDLSMLNPLPNITVLAPSSGIQLREMLYYYSKNTQGPIAIRYPKGSIYGEEIDWNVKLEALEEPNMELVIEGKDIAILSVGNMLENSYQAVELLNGSNIYPSLWDVKRVKPLNIEMLNKLISQNHTIITVEDGSVNGGFGHVVKAFVNDGFSRVRVVSIGFPMEVIEHASTAELYIKYGLNSEGIFKTILNTKQDSTSV